MTERQQIEKRRNVAYPSSLDPSRQAQEKGKEGQKDGERKKTTYIMRVCFVQTQFLIMQPNLLCPFELFTYITKSTNRKYIRIGGRAD